MEVIKKYPYKYPSYEIRVASNTDTVNAIRSIVVREKSYVNSLYELGKYILQPGIGESVQRLPIGDASVYTPDAKDIMWNYESGDKTIDNVVDFNSVDAISVTLARFIDIVPSTSWSQIACIAFWMLYMANSYDLQFVQYKLFIEGVNPFTPEQIEQFNSGISAFEDIPKFAWPMTNSNQTVLDILRKSYAECVVKSNADIVNDDWFCIGQITPPVCPVDLQYITKPIGIPTIYNTIAIGVMNPNKTYFEWLAYDDCVLSNSTSPISSAPKFCTAPTTETVVKTEENFTKYYVVAGVLATISLGLFAWSFWPKDTVKEAEKEYQRRTAQYSYR